jgi:tRNA(adenine34) deaminase
MNKLFFFGEALKLAKRAGARDEIPIAAVLVKEGKIIARAYNQTEKKKSFLAHAEILCLQKAAKFLKSKYLDGCSLYITLEPCKVCEAL